MKKIILIIGLILLILGTVLFFQKEHSMHYFQKPISVSRIPENGCVWNLFESKILGIEMPVQKCKDPNMNYVLEVVDNLVVQYRASDEKVYNSPVALQVFTKKETQSIKEAISEKLPEKNENCIVAEENSKTNSRITDEKGKERYIIKPNDALMARIQKSADVHGEVPDYSECGEYGIFAEGTTYFEYQPENSKERYLYVDIGQDEPLFDEKNIRIRTPR
jgi:hypothetical protein